jgi:hypothetical protein
MALKGSKHFFKRTDPPFTLERAFLLAQPKGECLIWDGPTYSCGYGRVPKHNFTGESLAHRFVYAATHGVIIDGLYVCHECDNPLCVNPNHIFLGTQLDNMQDMAKKGRWYSPLTFTGQKHTEATKEKMKAAWRRRRNAGIFDLLSNWCAL